MATTRIKDLTTASAMADDDFIAIDGATNGTRKIAASDVGGGGIMYDHTCNSGNTLGVQSSVGRYCTVADASAVTTENILKIKAYGEKSTYTYPLVVDYVSHASGASSITIWMFCPYGSVQGTTYNMKVHIVAPFEITADSAAM